MVNGKSILENVSILKSEGDQNIEILGVATDSRVVAQGFVFIAVVGLTVDGHDYIKPALCPSCLIRRYIIVAIVVFPLVPVMPISPNCSVGRP